MSRYFSFGVLLAVIVLLIIMFYKLMIGFFVPLFLAALLVVIFRPLHDWFLKRCRGRNQLAAGLTTTSVCLVVFVPTALIFMLAASEGRVMLQRFTSGAIINQWTDLRRNLRLDIPAVEELRALETEFNSMISTPDPEQNVPVLMRHLAKVRTLSDQFQIQAGLPAPDRKLEAEEGGAVSELIRSLRSEPPDRAWLRFRQSLDELQSAALRPAEPQSRGETGSSRSPQTQPEQTGSTPTESQPSGTAVPAEDGSDKADSDEAVPDIRDSAGSTGATDHPEADPQSGVSAKGGASEAAGAEQATAAGGEAQKPGSAEEEPLSVGEALTASIRSLDGFRTSHCGGKTWSWLKLMSNPTSEELEKYGQQISVFLREKLPSIGGATTAVLGSFVFGLIIMVVALYFFLADGEAMLSAIKQLSPLDEADDDRLIAEFSTVSRAVVLATLLSALAQGIMAGIGFWACGIDQVFLLTILTTCLALVPFVGAAAVWVPVCVWLYVMENRMGAAIGLAIYGSLAISMIDNLIKPFVLHGQSNLHPLLALLSVLGGVTAIGPIGILIGPMIVALLQTTLEILRKELGELDEHLPVPESAAAPVAAAGSTPASGSQAGSPAALASKPKLFGTKGKKKKK